MLSTNETKITKAPSGKKLIVTRVFNAPPAKVWRAWTESDLLDKWWAPKPWRAETKIMNFSEGGMWLYAMVSPQGEKHWCRVDFETIAVQKSFTSVSIFCNEEAEKDTAFPTMYWNNEFTDAGTTTHITSEISFDSEADLEQIVKMGFKEGFTMGLGNLDELLAQ